MNEIENGALDILAEGARAASSAIDAIFANIEAKAPKVTESALTVALTLIEQHVPKNIGGTVANVLLNGMIADSHPIAEAFSGAEIALLKAGQQQIDAILHRASSAPNPAEAPPSDAPSVEAKS